VPSAALTDLAIAQRACARAGFQPISAFADSTAEATVLNQTFDSIVNDALAAFPWPFALQEAAAVRIVGTPPGEWLGSYTLPDTCLHLLSVRVNGNSAEWALYGNVIAVDALDTDEVRIEYTARVDAALFHPVFVEYLVHKLASVLATGVAHDAGRAELFEKGAQRYFRRARWASAKERTPGRLIASRLTGYR